MEFRILGPLEVVGASGVVPLRGPRLRALLAILLTRANEVVSSDVLVDQLFGEEPHETARNLVQVYVSRLRKALAPEGTELIVTRAPGYVLRAGADDVDLGRFERLTEEARHALQAGLPELGAARLAEALALWRGPALADFAFELFAQTEIARLEELRLAALEDRIGADLALGRHAALVAELEALVAEHPLRENLRGQLMLALYRSGRQAEALAVYQETRKALVEELGIEPAALLQELERAILRQDASLEVAPRAPGAGASTPGSGRVRSVVLLCGDSAELAALLPLVEPLVRTRPVRELILARLLDGADALSRASGELYECRDALAKRAVLARAAAFVSATPGEDAVRLASEQDADLLLLGGGALPAGPGGLDAALARTPCDVAFLARTASREDVPDAAGPVVVPFGASEHDWAALELGAWLASAHRARLVVVGSVGDRGGERRDASRLLARASLVVQQFADAPAEPLLTPPGADGILAVANGAAVLVVGVSERWRQEGLGPVRERIATRAAAPVLFVRRGVRPGGIAPAGGSTRFTWSLAGEAVV